MQKDFSQRQTSVDFHLHPTYKPLPIRADIFLTKRLSKRSRTQLQKLFKDHRVLVEGRPVAASYKLRGGETVKLLLKEDDEYVCPSEMDLEIIYEDDDLIAINKAAGVITHPAGSVLSGTLLNKVHHHFESIDSDIRPTILQRLDKDTSGLILMAKNLQAHKLMQNQITSHRIEKIYMALCSGQPDKNEGECREPIGEVSHPFKKKMGVYEGDGSKSAFTEYITLLGSGDRSLIGIRLHTGRQHQIRVHMSHLGHPLLGDLLYEGPSIMPRQGLHSYFCRFTHPSSKKEIELYAPLPDDFKMCLSSLLEDLDDHKSSTWNKDHPWNPRTWSCSSHKS